jgi:hypothetical protein
MLDLKCPVSPAKSGVICRTRSLAAGEVAKDYTGFPLQSWKKLSKLNFESAPMLTRIEIS